MRKRKITKRTVTTTVEETVVNGKTHIVCVLDSSGSMASTIKEARSGFNDFLKKQKKLEGNATLTVAIFDSSYNYKLLYDNIPLENTKKITKDDWYPRGMTALFDAIGKTTTSVEAIIKKLHKKDQPDKVLVTVVTDGMENDSTEYLNNDIKKLIARLEKKNWQFMYIGANQDAFAAGHDMGYGIGNTINYTGTAKGITAMFNTLNDATHLYRVSSSNATTNKSLLSTVTDGTGTIGEDDYEDEKSSK